MHGKEAEHLTNRIRIWIPERNSSKIPIELSVGISGYYYIDLIDKDSGNIKQHLEFPNLITNAGLDAIGFGFAGGLGGSDGFAYLAVGTGSTTASTSDTTLVAEVGRTNSNGGILAESGSFLGGGLEYGYIRRTRVFTETQATGSLRELGFFRQSIDGLILNRSLFKDANGNSTTLIKTTQDLLRVQYEWRLTGPQNDITGVFEYFGGVTTSSFTLRPQGINGSTVWVPATFYMGFWAGSGSTIETAMCMTASSFLNSRTGLNPINQLAALLPASVSVAPYTSSNYYRDVTYRWDSQFGNVSGTSLPTLLVFSPWSLNNVKASIAAMYQLQYTSSLQKNTERLFELTLRHSWKRE